MTLICWSRSCIIIIRTHCKANRSLSRQRSIALQIKSSIVQTSRPACNTAVQQPACKLKVGGVAKSMKGTRNVGSSFASACSGSARRSPITKLAFMVFLFWCIPECSNHCRTPQLKPRPGFEPGPPEYAADALPFFPRYFLRLHFPFCRDLHRSYFNVNTPYFEIANCMLCD